MSITNKRKITFVTYHNWRSKRHGGFHQFADYFSKVGYDVIFFSFSRPYYTIFKKEERQNARVLKSLTKGEQYNNGEGYVLNITWPTLALPGYLRKYLPGSINKWLMTNSFIRFSKIQDKWLNGSSCFIFESCDAVFLLDLVKKYNPKAKIFYRPSDPIVDLPSEDYLIEAERKMLLAADLTILVNEESRELYHTKFGQSYNDRKAVVIPNGVDVEAYLKHYDCPEVLDYPKTALYVGVFAVDWTLLKEAALSLPDIRFVIVNPNIPSNSDEKIINSVDNLYYVPGINPTEVPKWVTNASIIIQPFPKDNIFSRRIGLSLTAMHYKSIAANKPIIAHMVKKSMENYGLCVTETTEEFIEAVKRGIDVKVKKYNYDVRINDWTQLCERFKAAVEK